MKEKLMQIKNALPHMKSKKRNIALSIVALVQIIAILIASTYSWVETVSTIKLSGSGQIDTYTMTDAVVNSSLQNQVVDLKKYFKPAGNMHLSAASSANGVDMYFPTVASTGTVDATYRKGDVNDKNVNYISFSFNVKADGSDLDFVFDSVPTIKIGNETITDGNTVRVAITVNSSTKIYSFTKQNENVVADISGLTLASEVRAFSDYLKDGAKLFSIGKNSTKKITISLWLQNTDNISDYAGKEVTVENFKISTDTSTETTFSFVDRTTAHNGTSNGYNWVSNNSANMWIYNQSSATAYKMTKDSSDSTLWSVDIPKSVLTNTTSNFIFYRCASSVTSNPQNNYYNSWTTTLGAADLAGTQTYTAYGNIKSGKEGFGTWASVAEIQFYSENPSILPVPSDYIATTAVNLVDSAGNSYPMNYHNNLWRAFIPPDSNSQNLKFSFTYNKAYTISAVNRDISEVSSKYVLTSATTGYWEPAATVWVHSSDETKGITTVTGGVEDAIRVKVTAGTTVTLTAEVTSDDYMFVGWYDNAEMTGTPISTDPVHDYVARLKNTTYNLYAKFMTQHKVTLQASTDGTTPSAVGGTVQIDDNTTAGASVEKYVPEGSTVTIKAAAKEGYEFLGWFDNAGLTGDPVYSVTQPEVEITNVADDITLFAKFNAKTFNIEAHAVTKDDDGTLNPDDSTGGTVKFDSDAQSKAYVTTTKKAGDSVVFRAVVKATDGYKFVGWYSDEACSDDKLVSSDANYTVTDIKEEIILYAKFELKTYTVTVYAVSDGTVNNTSAGSVSQIINNVEQTKKSSITLTVSHGSAVTFKATKATNCNFTGWYNASTSASLDSSNPTQIALTITSAMTIHAKFESIKYTAIAYAVTGTSLSNTGGNVKVGNGSQAATSTDTVKHGGSITFTATANTSSGYSFSGWYTAKTNGSRVTTDASYTINSVDATTNLKLYAIFVKSGTTVYFANSHNWGNVYCYAFGDNGEKVKWPGELMTSLGTNGYGQKQYSFTVPSDYHTIIFNDGSGNQTIDIKLSNYSQTGFYPYDNKNGQGKYEVGTFTYAEQQ